MKRLFPVLIMLAILPVLAPRSAVQPFTAYLPMLFTLGGSTVSSLGPSYPGTCADDASVGTQAWVHPSYVQTGNYAFFGAPPTGVYSHYLKGTGYGFSIASNQVIDGIQLDIARRNMSATVQDNAVYLLKSGVLVGSNYKKTAAWATWQDSVATYGSPTDKWGTTWTPAEINSALGAVLQIYVAYNPGDDVQVGKMQLTVYYHTAVPPVADFTASPSSGASPLSVSFTDLSTNSPTSWSWNFGDGSTSVSQNPSHTYAAAGNYTVSLTATNGDGSGSVTKSAYILVSGSPATFNRPQVFFIF